jgi:hypothetical protein
MLELGPAFGADAVPVWPPKLAAELPMCVASVVGNRLSVLPVFCGGILSGLAIDCSGWARLLITEARVLCSGGPDDTSCCGSRTLLTF